MMRKLTVLLALFLSVPAFGATCKISEYRTLTQDASGAMIPVALEPALTTQTVTYTTSAQSAAFNANTRFIRVVCDAKAHFRISTAGTNATANSPYLPADTPEYFGVGGTAGLVIDFYDGSS